MKEIGSLWKQIRVSSRLRDKELLVSSQTVTIDTTVTIVRIITIQQQHKQLHQL